ncbi:unnamed protein product [Symbiodinium sp. CCMP2592]|nr:unnamed protein product [Symbiodinium sp. CCMP2592]
MAFEWSDAMLSPISEFLIEEARLQRFDPNAFLPNLPVLALLQEEAAAQKALEAAARRRTLAANVAASTVADASGVSKRTRPKDITASTPTCKTPNPKHVKSSECVAVTPSVDTPNPNQQTPLVNTPNQPTPLVSTPNKQLFATPAKGYSAESLEMATPDVVTRARALHNELMDSTLHDTLMATPNRADADLETQIDADLAKLSLEDPAMSQQSSNLGSGPDAVQVQGSVGTDNATSALLALVDVLQKNPSDMQKALLRPGTVEFEAIAAAVQAAKTAETQQLQALQAPQGNSEQAPQGSTEQAPKGSTEQAPPQQGFMASQAMDSYLENVYSKSHRCDSRSPPGMRPEHPEPEPVPPKLIDAQEPKPMEVEPKAPQVLQPLASIPQAPISKVVANALVHMGPDQALQKPEPIAQAPKQAPQEPQPIAQAPKQAPQEPQPIAQAPIAKQAPQEPQPIAQAPIAKQAPQEPQPIAQASEQAPQAPQAQQQQMPPPSQVPRRDVESNPALPPSSAPSTPGPSDVDDDPELSALADVAHQLKEAARKTRMRFLRSFESKKCPAVILEQWNRATNTGGPRDSAAVDKMFREYIMAGESWGCSRVVAVQQIVSRYSAEGVYVWINKQDPYRNGYP